MIFLQYCKAHAGAGGSGTPFFNVERGLTIGDEVKLLGPFPSAQDCEAKGGGGGVSTSFFGEGGVSAFTAGTSFS